MDQRHFELLPKEWQFLIKLYEITKADNPNPTFTEIATLIGIPDNGENRDQILGIIEILNGQGYTQNESEFVCIQITPEGVEKAKNLIDAAEAGENLTR